MRWKEGARARCPKRQRAALAADIEENGRFHISDNMGKWEGLPICLVSHERDVVEDGEYIGTLSMRRGDVIVPKTYVHPKLGIIGDTLDVKKTSKGIAVYIDAILRDKETGEPLLYDLMEIDASGWFLLSELIDAGFGPTTVQPGRREALELPYRQIERENRKARIAP